MPIPHNAFFYWAGRVPISYARYTTMASFRIAHPDWNMYLYTSDSSQDEQWGAVFQDFQFNPSELKGIVSNVNKRTEKEIPSEWVTLADKILISEEIDQYQGIKYQSREIAAAFMTSKTTDELTVALNKIVENRKAKDALKPPPHNYKKDAVERLGVQLRNYTPADPIVYKMPCSSVSDVFSLEILIEHGGFYFDLDQLILRNFEPIANNYEFVMGGQDITYIGLFGACPGSECAQSILPHFIKGFTSASYNSTGIPAVYNNCIAQDDWMRWMKTGGQRNHIAPQYWFYPVNAHTDVEFWDGTLKLRNCDSYACHWFGGNGAAKEWATRLTPENIASFDNILGEWARKVGPRKELCQ